MKKQESWFRTDNEIQFENSFKFWFALQWQNRYIQLFVMFFALQIAELVGLNDIVEALYVAYDDGIGTGLFVTPFVLLPLAGMLIIGYKGFWQFWNDIKHGTSR